MAYQINFFGWCSEDGHDKVWGYVTLGDTKLYNFWGKRGKRFAFQEHKASWHTADELRRKAKNKCKAGRSNGAYQEIPVADIETVVPDFYEQFERQLTLAKLFENFRGRREEETV